MRPRCRSEHFGGVSAITVPDNLKSAVSRACRYEPELNPTYQDMALHYGTAVLPARPMKPGTKPRRNRECKWSNERR
jgi:transposase